jgi:hypothetical protein
VQRVHGLQARAGEKKLYAALLAHERSVPDTSHAANIPYLGAAKCALRLYVRWRKAKKFPSYAQGMAYEGCSFIPSDQARVSPHPPRAIVVEVRLVVNGLKVGHDLQGYDSRGSATTPKVSDFPNTLV